MTQPSIPLLSWGFLLFPGFPMACLTSAIEPLRAANEITGRADFAWTLLGETSGPVRSSAGVGFDTDQLLAEAQPRRAGRVGGPPGTSQGAASLSRALDVLICLSPPDAQFRNPRSSNGLLRRLGRAGVVLGGFSGGVFPLARAGALGAHRPAVHWCYEAAWGAEFPDLDPSHHVLERGEGRITVAGAGAVFDLMLRIIAEHESRALMTEVACWFQHPFVRDEDATQATPVAQAGGTQDMLPPPVREAVRLFQQNIEEPLAIAEVAQRVALSERTLERAFRAATGETPLRFYRRLRLERGRQRVLYSTDSITEVARSAGFSSSTDFARHYAQAFGRRPTEERQRLAGLRGLSGAVPPARD
jgi:transcriptional regulator GlxA family with amidase domain